MTEELIVETLNQHAPACVQTLGGRLLSYNEAERSIRMRFKAVPAFCHSVDIVQGGFITGMLDAAMSHAVFAVEKGWVILPTLEIKISFLEAVHPGDLFATGRIVRLGKSVVFLEGELRDAEGMLLATASSTARVIRKHRHSP
jgi:uncharacterized protein (TIGR00369 family)